MFLFRIFSFVVLFFPILSIGAESMRENYFPLRAFYYAAPISWLPAEQELPAAGRATARWVDETALSGDRYLRVESRADAPTFERAVTWKGAGMLRLRMRSRQMVPGSVRLVAADGKVLAERLVSPQTEWDTVSLSLPEHTGEARLVLAPKGAAQWEMQSADFLAFDREGWLTDLRAREAAGHPGNLLPHSGFPLGLPQGWTLDRDSCPADGLKLATAASDVRGQSGLRIEAARSGWLRSPAFVAWPDSKSPDEALPHVVSLQVRGEGDITLRVLAGTQTLAEQVVQATPEEQTVRLPFTPAAEDSLLCLELSWKGAVPGVTLDALRIVPERLAGDGRLGRYPVEVAVAPRDAEGLQAPSEPLRVRAAVTDSAVDERLHLVVTDLYGQQIERDFVARGNEPMEIELAEPSLSAFGSYRVQARMVAADGAPRSGLAETILHRLPTPRFAEKAAPESRFGIHVLPNQRHLRMAAAIGLKWVRLHGPATEINYWFQVEPERGQWVLRPDRLACFREAGFSVLGKFTSTPRWASGQTQVVHTYFDQFVSPKDIGAWRTYVNRLLSEYESGIDVYEIWNEPWLDKFFSERIELLPDGSRKYVALPDPAASYAELTRAVRETVDAAAYQPKLIGLNTTTNRNVEGWIDGDEWTRRARAAGALDPVDIFSYHDYDRASDPLAQFDLSRRQFAFALGPEIDSAGRTPRPVWNTEGSPQPEGLSAGLYQALVPHGGEPAATVWNEAERLTRYLLGQFSAGVEKVFLYTMHNASGFTAGNGFNVLLAPDATLHPTGASLAALAQAIDPLSFHGIEPVQGGRLLRFCAEDGTRTTEVFLAETMAPESLPPAQKGFGKWRDLFGNEVDTVPRRGATFYREKITD